MFVAQRHLEFKFVIFFGIASLHVKEAKVTREFTDTSTDEAKVTPSTVDSDEERKAGRILQIRLCITSRGSIQLLY